MLVKLGGFRHFVRDRVDYLAAQGSFRQFGHGLSAEYLSLAKRLRLMWMHKTIRPDGEYLLRQCLRFACDGQPYFDLGSDRIFFHPERAVADEEAILQGALIILCEAYIRGQKFFFRRANIAPGDVILDLGGNLGTSALLFSRLTGSQGKVYSFEPVFHQLLQRNLRENAIDNVEVVAAGVGATSGEAVFAVTDIGIDSRFAPPSKGDKQGLNVPIIKLDDFVEQRQLQRLDFIKMDIEGAEELALRGAECLLAQFRPKLSIASYHTDFEGEKQHPKLLRLLREWGYQVEEIPNKHIYAWFD